MNIRFRSKDGELDRSVFVGQTCHNYTYIPADFDDSNWEKEVETILQMQSVLVFEPESALLR